MPERSRLVLVQVFAEPVQTAMMNHAMREVRWSMDGPEGRDGEGRYQKIGSWAANHFFHVPCGKTANQTLANARRQLTALSKKHGMPCTFRYEVD